MEIVFWAVVAIVALVVGYVCAINLWKRKTTLGHDLARSDAAHHETARPRFAGASKNV